MGQGGAAFASEPIPGVCHLTASALREHRQHGPERRADRRVRDDAAGSGRVMRDRHADAGLLDGDRAWPGPLPRLNNLGPNDLGYRGYDGRIEPAEKF